MKIVIKNINAAGDALRERVVLRAVEDCDIGNYAILATKRGSNPQTVEGGPIPHCFWFPDKRVHENDLVVLYTKKGTASSKQNSSGTTSHFFYWDLAIAIWTSEKVALVVEIGKQWSQLAVDEEEAIEEATAGESA